MPFLLTDVWAAGYYVNDFGISQTLVQHWDGAAWTVQTTPNTGGLLDNRFTSIEAVSATDIWAAGYYYDENARGLHAHRALRWYSLEHRRQPQQRLCRCAQLH